MSNYIKQVILIVMDGWGVAPSWGGNVISQAYTPNFNRLWRNYPHTELAASGRAVGLPGHEAGNSEVGHLNLGAGRVIFQDITFINKELTKENLDRNQAMKNLILHVVKNNSSINLMGLVSPGGVHSHIDHLKFLLQYFAQIPEVKDRVYIHGFTDGRDRPVRESIEVFADLQKDMDKIGCGKIATICGRYFAMDRDRHWQRTESLYNAVTLGIGKTFHNPLSAISQSYANDETDEFITPKIITDESDRPIHLLKNDDAVIFFNFRSDRARQITLAFSNKYFNSFHRKVIIQNIFFATMIPYGAEKEYDNANVKPLFKPAIVSTTLSKEISRAHLSQLHIAETEKYAHVTYFFNGGVENPYPGEDRILVPSPQVPTYDKKPEMSAGAITDRLLTQLKKKQYSLAVVNFANPDMVGHTGNYHATMRAIEFVDRQIKLIVDSVNAENTVVIITADHGNAEEMFNPGTGEMDTEHSTNPVPCILICPKALNISKLKDNMKLANVAPTILTLLGLPVPFEMDTKLY